ncbi:MAG TPA: amidohydrolase family protein [Opitutaceae bacterium]|nr:amidohydrolase family protein [Opitutaceae bacterium]
MHLYKHARIPIACLPAPLNQPTGAADAAIEPWRECDITVEGNRIVSVRDSASSSDGGTFFATKVTDLGGSLVFPGLLEVHTHLDKCYTWDRAPGVHSDFWESLHILGADSVNWSEEDVYRRAEFAVRTAWAHGTNAIRSHIDTGRKFGTGGHPAVDRLRSEWKGRIEIQTVSLVNFAEYFSGGEAAALEVTAKYKATAMGGFPQPNPDIHRQLDRLMAAARELGIGLDLHVDESGLAEAECLRATAEAVLRNQFPHPVACGHNCSLSVQSPERARETIALVKEAGMGIISLPLTNLHLQGRSRGPAPSPGAFGEPRTPQWRGLTLIHEFIEAGVPLACGGDNVRDAFIGWGDFDLVEVYVESVRLAHLDTRLDYSPAVVTTGPARIMSLPGYGMVAPGSPADMVVFPVKKLYSLLARPYSPRRLIRGEDFREVQLPDFAEQESWPKS